VHVEVLASGESLSADYRKKIFFLKKRKNPTDWIFEYIVKKDF